MKCAICAEMQKINNIEPTCECPQTLNGNMPEAVLYSKVLIGSDIEDCEFFKELKEN